MNRDAIRGRVQLAAAVAVSLLLSGHTSWAMGQPHQHKKQPLHEHKKLAHEQIEGLEQQWQQATLNDDVAAMDKLLSDDYLGITASGDLVTKAQQLDRMRTRILTLSKLDNSDVKIKLIGSIAIVTSLAQVEGTSDGKPLQGSFRYTRVYQRLPGGSWNITSFEATRIPHSGKNTKDVANVGAASR